MTTTPKGTHGVLTNSNSGVTIPSTVHSHVRSGFFARIDGVPPESACINAFYSSEGWSFKPDLVLPTRIGAAVRISHPKNGTATWMLILGGSWYSDQGNSKQPREFVEFIERNGFTVTELS